MTPESAQIISRLAQGLPASLIRTESGGNFQALNNEQGAGGRGHGGRGQFGHARLEDAARAGVIPAGTTPQQFAQMPPEVQMRVEQWHSSDIANQITRRGLDRYVGQNIGGTQVTPEGMLAVAHLGGMGGLEKFLTSGGEYNPSDSFGTSLSNYLATHGGQTAPQGGMAFAAAPQTPQQPQNALAPAQNAPQQPQLNLLDQRQDPAAFMMAAPQMGQNMLATPFDTQRQNYNARRA